MSIVAIDMHIRDERVLVFLREKSQDGEITIAADEIAKEFKCHHHTARSILTRLTAAGYLTVNRSVYKGGFTYRISSVQRS